MQKLPTINQINGRLLNQPGITEYLYHSSDKQRYSNHYKQRYFNFCYEYEGEKVTRNLSIIGNFLFCAALKEKVQVIGTPDNYHTANKPEVKVWLRDIYFIISTKIEFTGVFMYVRTNCKAIGAPEYYRDSIYTKFKVSSNKTFEDFNQEDHFLKYLNKVYLLPEGLFREIQLAYNLTKKEVPAKYRELLQESKNAKKYEVDTNRALVKRLSKKLNIVVDQYEIIQNYKLLKLLNSEVRQPKKVKAVKAPSTFDILEDASRQYDTEDEILGYADEVLSNYKGMILI